MTQPIPKRVRDLTGQTFGRLTVRGFARANDGRPAWICQCICGGVATVRAQALTAGDTSSCGCIHREASARQFANKPSPQRKIWGLSAFNQLFDKYRRQAVNRGHVFELSAVVFRELTSANCHYCGALPTQTVRRAPANQLYGDYPYNGIDRVDNNRGYTLDNVRTCCKACNYGKRTMTEAEFYTWVRRVAARIPC